MLGILAGGTALLHLRASADAPAVVQPRLPVRTVSAERRTHYTIEERFAGRLEPARETELAFERAGLVMGVLVDEGDRIAEGDVVAVLDVALLEAERERLQAERDAAEADLELAELTAKRQRDLSARGHSPVQRYDEARLAASALVARIGEIDAEIRKLDIDLAKSTLEAPFAGTVGARRIDEGAVVEAGAPLIRLLESDRPRARIGLSPDAVGRLDPDATYRLRAGDEVLQARVAGVRSDLASSTRTVPVLFEVSDRKRVPFGEVVELVLRREVESPGFWLPRAALTEGQKGLWDVLTVVDDEAGPVIRREAVEVVHVDGEWVFVQGTLIGGARVVAGGSHRIIPGQRVEVLNDEGSA